VILFSLFVPPHNYSTILANVYIKTVDRNNLVTATPGQGQLINVVPEEQFIFISWFTFTDVACDNPNEQLWYTAQGTYSGDIWVTKPSG
jgi:hypothetical protein